MNDKITECQDCTAGFACDTKGLSLPKKQCARSTDQRPNEGKCTAGHYCEVGSEMEQPCEAGYYIPFELAEECVLCPAGYYCPMKPSRIPRDDPEWPDKIICPESHFCPAGSSEPKKCPDGTLTSDGAVGLRASSECKPCPTGKWCKDGEEKGSCDPGYFCLAGASEPDPEGDFEFDPDGLGLSNDTICSTDISCAGPCPAGYYCPDEGTLLPLPCDENFYIEPPGGLFRKRGAISKNECRKCPAGFWCRPGIAEPEPCPVGFYCPEDEFEPVACAAKTYRNETGGSVPEDCKTCTIGYYCNNLGMVDQEQFPCKPGYYCRGGNEEPRKCPAGHYRSETGGKCGDEVIA